MNALKLDANVLAQRCRCVQVGVPQSCIMTLRNGFCRIIRDALHAYKTNTNIVIENHKRLLSCVRCLNIAVPHTNCQICINGDDLAKKVDYSMFGKLNESSDLLLFVSGESGELCMVEGKLGQTASKKPRNPTQAVIAEKYDWTMSRCNRMGLVLCKKFILLVTNNTLQQMRYKTRRWNMSDATRHIECTCSLEMLQSLGVECQNIATCDREV